MQNPSQHPIPNKNTQEKAKNYNRYVPSVSTRVQRHHHHHRGPSRSEEFVAEPCWWPWVHLTPHAREQGKDDQKVFYQPQEQEESLPTQNIRSKWGRSTDLESLGELPSTEPPALSGRGV